MTFACPSDAYTGALVPSVVDGRLRGVHRTAINVELSDAMGPFFVSIIRDIVDWSEYAVLLPETAWNHLRAVLPPTGSPISLTMNSDRARPHPQSITSPLSLADLPAPSGDVVAVLDEATQYLMDSRDGGGAAAGNAGGQNATGDGGFLPLIFPGAGETETLADPFLRRAASVLRAIGERGYSTLDLSPLVGLGIGFTPSGDDFISGALLASTFLPTELTHSDPTAKTVGTPCLDTESIRRSLHKTTSGGATLLRLALGGTPPAYQLAMLAELLNENSREVVAIARSHGHSSGLDTLAGVIWMTRQLTLVTRLTERATGYSVLDT